MGSEMCIRDRSTSSRTDYGASMESLVDMWHRQVLSIRDAALELEKLFAAGLPTDQYQGLPDDLRRRILHDLDEFASSGVRRFWIAQSSAVEPVDESEAMRRVAAAFSAAGIWSGEASLKLGPSESARGRSH